MPAMSSIVFLPHGKLKHIKLAFERTEEKDHTFYFLIIQYGPCQVLGGNKHANSVKIVLPTIFNEEKEQNNEHNELIKTLYLCKQNKTKRLAFNSREAD